MTTSLATGSTSQPGWKDWPSQAGFAFPVPSIATELAGAIFSFRAERREEYLIFQVIVPLVLIVAMSWIVFWIDPKESGTRISVAITTMLTLIAYRFAVGTDLPKVDYMTRLDFFILGSTVLIYATLLQAVITTSMAKSGKLFEAREVDVWCRWLFPRRRLIMSLTKRLGAEFIGTFWLVFGGCGSAVLAAGFPELGIGFVGVSLAFGLSVLTMAYAVGHISGGHFNPAVTVGLWAGGRFPASDIIPYWIAQVVAAIVAAAVLYLIASGQAGFDLAGGFASNGYGEHSPGGYPLLSALVAEIVLTVFFLIIILGSTDKRAPAGFAPIAIGLALTLIHLISIPVTNTSVNPARSTGPALFVGGWAMAQLWLFWVAPLIGGALGGLIYRRLGSEQTD